jgi:hypothetical protein
MKKQRGRDVVTLFQICKSNDNNMSNTREVLIYISHILHQHIIITL